MNRLIGWTRAWAGLLTTSADTVSWPQRLIRGALLVPVFSLLVLVLRLRLRFKGAVITQGQTASGQHFRCRLPDLIQMYIALFGRWEPDLTRLITQRLHPGDVFIDVGANIGYYTLLASACVGAQGRVVAIDALPSNFDELQHNLNANVGTDNVHAINRAVSDKPGVLAVYAGPAHNAGLATTAPGDRHQLQREASIPAAPLDQLLEGEDVERARVLKIDVEGAEAGVVAGLGRFLENCHPALEIFLELSPGWWSDASLTPEQVIKPLREAGFHTYLMDNNYWPWRYLWPNVVRRPRRVQRLPDKRVKRIDLVLSRRDAPEL